MVLRVYSQGLGEREGSTNTPNGAFLNENQKPLNEAER